jgi:hypothetical protein
MQGQICSAQEKVYLGMSNMVAKQMQLHDRKTKWNQKDMQKEIKTKAE